MPDPCGTKRYGPDTLRPGRLLDRRARGSIADPIWAVPFHIKAPGGIRVRPRWSLWVPPKAFPHNPSPQLNVCAGSKRTFPWPGDGVIVHASLGQSDRSPLSRVPRQLPRKQGSTNLARSRVPETVKGPFLNRGGAGGADHRRFIQKGLLALGSGLFDTT